MEENVSRGQEPAWAPPPPTAPRDKCQLLNHEPLAFPAQEAHVSPAETAAGSSQNRSGDNGRDAACTRRRRSKKPSGRVPTDARRLRGGELLRLLVFPSICSSVPPNIDAGLFLLPMLSHRRPPHPPPEQNMSEQYPWIISNPG